MLIAGTAMVALALLVPASLQVDLLRQHRDAADRLLAHLQTRHDHYTHFITAVRRGDPMLLQRLAWHELHLKPVGANTFDDLTPAEPGQAVHCEQWLRAGDPPPAPTPTVPNSQLVRLTTRPAPRLGLFALGGLLIGCGLLTSGRPDADDRLPFC